MVSAQRSFKPSLSTLISLQIWICFENSPIQIKFQKEQEILKYNFEVTSKEIHI